MDFVVFSDDWGRHPSSCQHLFARLSRRHRVLWVNTIGMRAPALDGFTAGRSLDKLRQWARPLRRIHEGLWVYSPPMLPVTGDQRGAGVNASLTAAGIRRVLRRLDMHAPVLFSSIPTGADYIDRLGESAVVYYITDDYRLWPGAAAETIAAQNARLRARADLLLPAGGALAEGLDDCPGRVVPLPHGVDIEHFMAADPPAGLGKSDRAALAAIAAATKPRLCFFGLIYEMIDLDLLARCARANPRSSLVLVGPTRCDISQLTQLPNVVATGAVSYAALPACLHACDALLSAYRLDGRTLPNAPLKIRECLAVGKPVIARGIPDLQQYAGLIHLAHNEQDFERIYAQAGHLHADPAAMRAAVSADTWASRAEIVERELGALPGFRRAADVVSADENDINISASPSAGAEWQAYVRSHPGGSVWHHGGWLEVMRGAYGLRCWALTARRGGRVVGALPLALQSSLAFGRHLVSLPWLDWAGVLADDADIHKCLVDKAMQLAKSCRADLCLRHGPAFDPPAEPDARVNFTRTDKLAMVLDLPATGDELWKGLGGKVRNQIRKAEKSQLVARWAGPAEVDLFHQVYAANMRDLGSPPHSLRFFARVLEHLPELARIMLVMQEDLPVAAGLILRDPAGWQIPWASSLRSHNHLCPNHLLYWSILDAACGQAGSFSFGRSSVDSGTYRFKAQWGAQPQPLRWDYLLTEPGATGRPSPMAELISRAWRRTPVALARRLGPAIIKGMS